MDNNQVTNNVDNNYINPKTGSGYVSAGSNNMDFSIAIVLITLIVVIVGGIFLIFNNDDFWDEVNDICESIVEIFDDSYYEDDEYYEDDYYDDSYYDE